MNCDQEPMDMGMDEEEQVYVEDNNCEMPAEIVFDPVQFPTY